MTTTFLLNTSITGASAQATDLLAGTAVANAGPSGKVWASGTMSSEAGAFVSYLDGTWTLFGRESGSTVVPADSGFIIGADPLPDQGKVVFFGQVRPNEPLALNITSSENSSKEHFSIMIKTE